MRAPDAYLSVSRLEIEDAIEAMSFSQKRDLFASWEAKKINGHTHKCFKDWAVDYVEQQIQADADAANRSYY